MGGRAAVPAAILAALCCGSAMAAGTPLKVYILAGQSNMQGAARIETFDYIGDDPATAPLLKEMRGPDGKPRVCDKVWTSYLTGSKDSSGEGFGKLTTGCPNRHKPGGYDLYPELLAQFIRDVRKELSAPEMPFVIGVMGVHGVIGEHSPDGRMQHFRKAMAQIGKAFAEAMLKMERK